VRIDTRITAIPTTPITRSATGGPLPVREIGGSSRRFTSRTVGLPRANVIVARVDADTRVSTHGWTPKFDPRADDVIAVATDP